MARRWPTPWVPRWVRPWAVWAWVVWAWAACPAPACPRRAASASSHASSCVGSPLNALRTTSACSWCGARPSHRLHAAPHPNQAGPCLPALSDALHVSRSLLSCAGMQSLCSLIARLLPTSHPLPTLVWGFDIYPRIAPRAGPGRTDSLGLTVGIATRWGLCVGLGMRTGRYLDGQKEWEVLGGGIRASGDSVAGRLRAAEKQNEHGQAVHRGLRGKALGLLQGCG
mmetsp:Transcript_36308/g.91692  ORF Transcript_36308/g.91692 Transcript_36308/m.91692 type:complete len:226 (+) Transcript_36308:313-990(+)